MLSDNSLMICFNSFLIFRFMCHYVSLQRIAAHSGTTNIAESNANVFDIQKQSSKQHSLLIDTLVFKNTLLGIA